MLLTHSHLTRPESVSKIVWRLKPTGEGGGGGGGGGGGDLISILWSMHFLTP